jgi:hypothetical protein
LKGFYRIKATEKREIILWFFDVDWKGVRGETIEDKQRTRE